MVRKAVKVYLLLLTFGFSSMLLEAGVNPFKVFGESEFTEVFAKDPRFNVNTYLKYKSLINELTCIASGDSEINLGHYVSDKLNDALRHLFLGTFPDAFTFKHRIENTLTMINVEAVVVDGLNPDLIEIKKETLRNFKNILVIGFLIPDEFINGCANPGAGRIAASWLLGRCESVANNKAKIAAYVGGGSALVGMIAFALWAEKQNAVADTKELYNKLGGRVEDGALHELAEQQSAAKASKAALKRAAKGKAAASDQAASDRGDDRSSVSSLDLGGTVEVVEIPATKRDEDELSEVGADTERDSAAQKLWGRVNGALKVVREAVTKFGITEEDAPEYDTLESRTKRVKAIARELGYTKIELGDVGKERVNLTGQVNTLRRRMLTPKRVLRDLEPKIEALLAKEESLSDRERRRLDKLTDQRILAESFCGELNTTLKPLEEKLTRASERAGQVEELRDQLKAEREEHIRNIEEELRKTRSWIARQRVAWQQKQEAERARAEGIRTAEKAAKTRAQEARIAKGEGAGVGDGGAPA
ncbi:hypothetical protein KAW80_04665 [Candidatus Babeliales bacterium]|nr:hypothetical protein [Candidatus Babeliales bacterium]